MRTDWEVTDYIWERDGVKTRANRSGYDALGGCLRPRMRGIKTQIQCVFIWERHKYLEGAQIYHTTNNGGCYLMEIDDP